MKNNIDESLIFNRKLIIELRFGSTPKFLDSRGTLTENLLNLNIIKNPEWGIGDSTIKIADSTDDKLIRNVIQMEVNRLAFISSKIDSIDKFVNDFSKIYNLVKEIFGELNILRIGCRIQGTYKTETTEYDRLLTNFKNAFPNQIFFEDFPTTDLRLQIVYQNGTYHVGPINENDNFLKREFTYPERNNSVGLGIDTDNYLLKTDLSNINGFSKIKDVFIASLAVEKSLVNSLKDF